MTSLDWVAPQACTLPTTEQPLRVAEFDTLFAHLVAVDRVDATRARLVLAAGPRRKADDFTAAVRDLTERESACCSFFTFVVDGESDDLMLQVSVPQQHRDILKALAARAVEQSA